MNEELLPVVLAVEALSPDIEEAFEIGVKAAQKLGVHGVTFYHGDKDCYAYGRGDGTANIEGATVGTFSAENGYVPTQAYREAQETDNWQRKQAEDIRNANPYAGTLAQDEARSDKREFPTVVFALALAISLLLGFVGWREYTTKSDEFGIGRIEKELAVMNKAVEWAHQFGVAVVGMRCAWPLCEVQAPDACYQLDCFGESCRITGVAAR